MHVCVYVHTYTVLVVKLYKEMHCMYVHVYVHTYAVFLIIEDYVISDIPLFQSSHMCHHHY